MVARLESDLDQICNDDLRRYSLAGLQYCGAAVLSEWHLIYLYTVSAGQSIQKEIPNRKAGSCQLSVGIRRPGIFKCQMAYEDPGQERARAKGGLSTIATIEDVIPHVGLPGRV
jgi:hypothetical protein